MGELNAVSERGKVFGREGNLLGLFSEPRQGPEMPVAVVLLNAGIIHRVGASRFTVQLARTLAEAGYRTFRFDLSGIGDSALPRREAPLTDIVKQDIDDAITLTLEDGRCPGGVVLIGLCSGADNAFHVAPSDSRIRGLVLIDPMVHETPGFRREKMKQRLTSARSWLNVVSGRSIALRLKDRLGSEDGALPPDHYGLLTDPPEAMQEKAKQLEADGVRLLYVLTGGAHRYCNYPGQVADSLRLSPRSPVLQVEWRPQANHILSDRTDRQWLYRTVLQWLPDVNNQQPSSNVGR